MPRDSRVAQKPGLEFGQKRESIRTRGVLELGRTSVCHHKHSHSLHDGRCTDRLMCTASRHRPGVVEHRFPLRHDRDQPYPPQNRHLASPLALCSTSMAARTLGPPVHARDTNVTGELPGMLLHLGVGPGEASTCATRANSRRELGKKGWGRPRTSGASVAAPA